MLGKLARQHDENVLVGFDHADDAGVYKISADLALVQTVDFFTPIVDDPFTFGQIAASNALSDIYAMGGKPMSSLALVCFPDGGDLDILERILAGGISKMMEAECTVIGGHSIRDPEIKFGYAVTGAIHPDHVFTNGGAQPGDVLLLTKPLGTGVISTAIKRNQAQHDWVAAGVRSMTTLNRAAAEVLCGDDSAVHAVTDVTGFGLIGHAREMALASKVGLRIDAARIPLLPGALDCVRHGWLPGGLQSNREFAEGDVAYSDGAAGAAASEDIKTLLFDPQTAGGLLIAVAASGAAGLLNALHAAEVPAAMIGVVVPAQQPLIIVH